MLRVERVERLWRKYGRSQRLEGYDREFSFLFLFVSVVLRKIPSHQCVRCSSLWNWLEALGFSEMAISLGSNVFNTDKIVI